MTWSRESQVWGEDFNCLQFRLTIIHYVLAQGAPDTFIEPDTILSNASQYDWHSPVIEIQCATIYTIKCTCFISVVLILNKCHSHNFVTMTFTCLTQEGITVNTKVVSHGRTNKVSRPLHLAQKPALHIKFSVRFIANYVPCATRGVLGKMLQRPDRVRWFGGCYCPFSEGQEWACKVQVVCSAVWSRKSVSCHKTSCHGIWCTMLSLVD